MRIKKDPIGKNEYIRAGNIWVRNFTNPDIHPVDLNQLFSPSDYKQAVINETGNRMLGHSSVTEQHIHFSKVLIVSDGLGFESKHEVLRNLPKDVAIFAVNEALAKWTLVGSKLRPINLFIANNPYKECLRYLPKKTKYYPTCIASTRANVEFVSSYKGNVYTYEPTPSRKFGMESQDVWHVDDYRNPVCAAIGLAYRFGVQKLAFLCCDNSFVDERPGAIKLSNGLWQYPQHQLSQDLIDANLYWLTHQIDAEIQVADFSSGSEYVNASYIDTEEGLMEFFIEDELT